MNELSTMAAFLPAIARFVLSTLAVWVLTHWLYFPKSRRREYYFTFMLIGVSVFLLIHLLGGTRLRIEFALGLFAIFGIIRYRTEQMPVREMTYLFTIIAMQVINGLSTTLGWGELVAVNLLFILAAFLLEHVRVRGSLAVKMVQYDRIELIKPDRRADLLADLRDRTGLDIVRVEIGGIDFLRDMSVIRIYYRADEASSVDGQLKLHQDEYASFQQN